MKQVKYFMSQRGVNRWLKMNQDKEIIDIMLSVGGFAVVYEEKIETGEFRIKKRKK